MPRGIPNKKKQDQTDGEPISKMEAMRRALDAKGPDAMPVDYQTYIKSKFGIEMDRDMISTYKSSLLKQAAEKKPTAPTPRAEAKTAGGFKLDELEAVKALADKIGADKVRQLAQVLAK